MSEPPDACASNVVAETVMTRSLPPDATICRLSLVNAPSVMTSEPPDAVNDTSAGNVTCTAPGSPSQLKKLKELLRRIESVLSRTSVTISAASPSSSGSTSTTKRLTLAQEEIDAAANLDGVESIERASLALLRVGGRRRGEKRRQNQRDG